MAEYLRLDAAEDLLQALAGRGDAVFPQANGRVRGVVRPDLVVQRRRSRNAAGRAIRNKNDRPRHDPILKVPQEWPISPTRSRVYAGSTVSPPPVGVCRLRLGKFSVSCGFMRLDAPGDGAWSSLVMMSLRSGCGPVALLLWLRWRPASTVDRTCAMTHTRTPDLGARSSAGRGAGGPR